MPGVANRLNFTGIDSAYEAPENPELISKNRTNSVSLKPPIDWLI